MVDQKIRNSFKFLWCRYNNVLNEGGGGGGGDAVVK